MCVCVCVCVYVGVCVSHFPGLHTFRIQKTDKSSIVSLCLCVLLPILSLCRTVLRPLEDECLRDISAAATANSISVASADICMHASSLADVQSRLGQIYCIKLVVHDLCVRLWATSAECTLQRCVEIGYAATEAVQRQLPAPPAEIEARDATSSSTHKIDLLTFSSVLHVHACARNLDRLCTHLSQHGWPTEERLRPPASIDNRWPGRRELERLHSTPSKHTFSLLRGLNQPDETSPHSGTNLNESRASSHLQHQLEQLFIQSPPEATDLQEKIVRQQTDLDWKNDVV